MISKPRPIIRTPQPYTPKFNADGEIEFGGLPPSMYSNVIGFLPPFSDIGVNIGESVGNPISGIISDSVGDVIENEITPKIPYIVVGLIAVVLIIASVVSILGNANPAVQVAKAVTGK